MPRTPYPHLASVSPALSAGHICLRLHSGVTSSPSLQDSGRAAAPLREIGTVGRASLPDEYVSGAAVIKRPQEPPVTSFGRRGPPPKDGAQTDPTD